MRSKSLAYALLSAVTSAECATAIEGDLLEERQAHGSLWFALHVLRTTFALFGLALTRAPFRTAALSFAAVTASSLACMLADRLFFASQALVPVPLVGFVAVAASAVAIGAALALFAGALGVRAALTTCALAVMMFVATQAAVKGEPSPIDEGPAPTTVGLIAAQLLLGFCVYLAPLLTASWWVHLRRT